jgi:dGTPase
MTHSRYERYHSQDSETYGDVRTPGQKDVDRILDSEAFRRLGNVTQVADSNEGRVFHNRLTHTLKVAQVARRLAEKLQLEQPDIAEALQLDPNVVHAAALAHDVGHPPFGHVAEKELDALVRQHGLVDGYEGNPQSFRILTKLEPSGRGYPGLNLTRATLNAIVKYPKLRQMKGSGNKKWGAYWTEKDIFEWVRHDSPPERRSVEAELMDWADDITFSLHDVEDFYKAGLISPTMFRADVTESEASAYLNEVLSRWERDKNNPDQTAFFEHVRDEAINFLQILPFTEPFKNTRTGFGNLRLAVSV